jgi:hypothetical protein
MAQVVETVQERLSSPCRDCPAGCGPGNAGANTAADHITVLDQALTQLWRYGVAPCGRSRTKLPGRFS